VLNDLWKFDGSNWHSVSLPATPPARKAGAVTTGPTGTAWLYGGHDSTSYLADIWTFDGTWQRRNLPSENATNFPGARSNAMIWTDIANNLWIFGGERNQQTLNDLWAFDGSQWFYVSPDQEPSFGVLGVPSASNIPRRNSRGCTLPVDSGVILFGGLTSPNSYFNDVWFYDYTTWTWLAGDPSQPTTGSYKTQGINRLNYFNCSKQSYEYRSLHQQQLSQLSRRFQLLARPQ